MEKTYCPYCNTEVKYENKKSFFGMMEYKCSKCSKISVQPYPNSMIFAVVIILIINTWVYFTRMSQGEGSMLYLYAVIVCVGLISYNYILVTKVRKSDDNNKTE